MAKTETVGHALPTESEAVRAFADLIGPQMAEGLWDLTVRALGLSRPVTSAADLRRVAEHIMDAAELSRVAGRSLKVRIITYEALDRTVTG